MARMIEIKATKCIYCLTEKELTGLLAKDPELWRTAIGRGKGITRARQTQQRVERKVEKEMARDRPI